MWIKVAGYSILAIWVMSNVVSGSPSSKSNEDYIAIGIAVTLVIMALCLALSIDRRVNQKAKPAKQQKRKKQKPRRS